jgi:hypothetical protein
MHRDITPHGRSSASDESLLLIDDTIGSYLLQLLVDDLSRLDGTATAEWIDYLTSYAHYLRSHLSPHCQTAIPRVRSRSAARIPA